MYVVDVMYGSVLKTQLKMFSKCVQFKKHPDSEHFKNSYCFVFENGIKFRALNLANFLKSRNSILANISKNKETGPDRNKKSNTYGDHKSRPPFSLRSFL